MVRKIIFSLLYLILLWLIILWVFWESGHTLSYPNIKKAFDNPHQIDIANVIVTYHFPMLVTASIFLNLLAITFMKSFYTWIKTGKIRTGGVLL